MRTATEFVSRVIDACAALEAFPNRGAPRDDLAPNARLLGLNRRVAVVYRTLPAEVEILGVFYGGRDIHSILQDEL